MYSIHIRKNRKISLYHDTAMEVDTPYSVRGSREYIIPDYWKIMRFLSKITTSQV